MDWLRCNRCFRIVKTSSRSFSLTQCGHIFCDSCIIQTSKQCHVCGETGFLTQPLGKPPLLETKLNYFSSTSAWQEEYLKAMLFHEEQREIVFRGFHQMEKKYEKTKKTYGELMYRLNALSMEHKKLHVKQHQIREARRELMEKTKIMHNRDGMSSTSLNSANIRRDTKSHRHSMNVSASNRWNTPTETTSKYPTERPRNYNPSPAFSKSCDSGGCSTDSGHQTAIVTPISYDGIFLVPNCGKVPKSAATLKRSVKYPKVGFPKTKTDFQSHNY